MASLSPQSARLRFLAPKNRLTLAELRYLTEVDHVDHYALVAVLGRQPCHDGGRRALGARPRAPGRRRGRRRRRRLPTRARVSARRSAPRWPTAARALGIARFTAVMLPENTAAQRLLRAHLGAPEHARRRAAPTSSSPTSRPDQGWRRRPCAAGCDGARERPRGRARPPPAEGRMVLVCGRDGRLQADGPPARRHRARALRLAARGADRAGGAPRRAHAGAAARPRALARARARPRRAGRAARRGGRTRGARAASTCAATARPRPSPGAGGACSSNARSAETAFDALRRALGG